MPHAAHGDSCRRDRGATSQTSRTRASAYGRAYTAGALSLGAVSGTTDRARRRGATLKGIADTSRSRIARHGNLRCDRPYLHARAVTGDVPKSSSPSARCTDARAEHLNARTRRRPQSCATRFTLRPLVRDAWDRPSRRRCAPCLGAPTCSSSRTSTPPSAHGGQPRCEVDAGPDLPADSEYARADLNRENPEGVRSRPRGIGSHDRHR